MVVLWEVGVVKQLCGGQETGKMLRPICGKNAVIRGEKLAGDIHFAHESVPW